MLNRDLRLAAADELLVAPDPSHLSESIDGCRRAESFSEHLDSAGWMA